jgi:hypothetical protein
LSSFCPVCNGLYDLIAACPACGEHAVDAGRFNDYLGPYSPYRAIQDISLSNGFPDVASHSCVHLIHCPKCMNSFQAAVQEQTY